MDKTGINRTAGLSSSSARATWYLQSLIAVVNVAMGTKPVLAFGSREDFQYDLFISYRRREGASIASWLRTKLSHIRIPEAFSDRKPIRVYIDVAHDRVTPDFWDSNIAPALSASRFLLIVATPAVLESDTNERPNWVRREIDYFAKTPQRSNMVVVHASETEAPSLPDEIVRAYPRMHYVDLRSVRWAWSQRVTHYFERDEAITNALTSVAAACLDIEPPEMPAFREEQERYRRRRLVQSIVGLSIASLALIALTGWALMQRTLAAANEKEARQNQINAVANETRSLAALSIVASERGSYGDALTLALAAWPRSGPNNVRPRLETTLQAISLALRSSQGEIRRWEAAGSIHDVWFDETNTVAIGQTGENTISVWDLRPDAPPIKKVSVPGKLWRVQVSDDRRRILTNSRDGSFRLFDRDSLKQLGSTIKHGDSISNALFEPSGSRIITWSKDGTAQLWHSGNGAPIGKLMQHPNAVETGVFSETGRYVVTWSGEFMYIWDAATTSLVKGPLKSGLLGRGALFFDQDRRMLSWSLDKAVKLWDIESGSQLGKDLVHNGPVSGATLLDSEKRLLTWSGFGDLRLWDLKSRQQIGQTMKHAYSVNGVTVTTDEKTAFAWSGQYLYIWDLKDGAPRCSPIEHDGSVRGALFSRAQDRILAWTDKGKLRLWNIQTCEEAIPEMAHGRMTYAFQSTSWEKPRLSSPADGVVPVNGAIFSKNDQRILSWSDDGTLRLWDTATGQSIGLDRKHQGVVRGAALFDGDRRAASWAADGTFRIWDLEKGQQLGAAIRSEKGYARGALLTRNDKIIVYWSDGKLLAMNAESGSAILPPMEHWGVRGAVLNSDATKLLSWSETHGLVKLHSMLDGKPLVPEMHHQTSWTQAEFTQDERAILSWSNGEIKVWSVETGLQIGASMSYEDLAEIQGAVQRFDGKRFASWSRDGVIKLWDGTMPGKQIGSDIEQGRTPPDSGTSYRGALFLPDGRLIVWGKTGDLRVFDSETGADLNRPIVHGSEVLGATVSPSGSRLISWSLDGSIRIWSLPQLEPLSGPLKHDDVVDDVVLTKDERHLVSRSSSHIMVWETQSGRRAGSKMTHEENIAGMTLSRDQSRVISWTYDGTIHLWDLRSGQQIAPPLQHAKESDEIGVAFSSDGKRLLAWGGEFLRWWNIDIPAGDLLRIGCLQAGWSKTTDHIDKYGVTITEPICASSAMPADLDWATTTPASGLLRVDNRYQSLDSVSEEPQ